MNSLCSFFYFLLLSCGLLAVQGCQTTDAKPAFSHEGRRIVGYWHNWNSQSVPYLSLEEVPKAVNTLVVAFALPEKNRSGRMAFKPEKVTPDEFKKQIKRLQKSGVDVLISVGGGNHPVELTQSWMKLNFVTSMQNIIDTYGFDGMDINFEGASKVLEEGDLEFKKPTSKKILNMIDVVKQLDAHYGEDFLISVTPETQYLVSGYNRYGGAFGGYLPFLDALRDEVDLLQMQLYNSGSQFVYTGEDLKEGGLIVEQGTADFVVGLTEMLIQGFPVGRDPKQYFEGYPADKIVVGLPAMSIASSGGALSADDFRKAMVYLMTGVAEYDTKLTLRQPGGYPDLKGVMTWSINWDASEKEGRDAFAFVRQTRAVLVELVPVK